MKKDSLITISWAALLGAVLAWCAVGFFAYTVVELQSERAAYATEAAAANLEEGQAAQLHALARETVLERTNLSKAAEVDVLSAVNLIESVRSGNAGVKVTSAQAEKVANKTGGPPINTVLLNVHAEGSFNSVMRVAQMLETLPLMTTVQAVDINRDPVDADQKNTNASWSLNVRLRFFTTTTLSS